ncbi:MAG TPA: hypothetical protein VM841_14310 [Actinomycetota bacterium]|nr:hypothetical protein [Actinomycetota bacterium]
MKKLLAAVAVAAMLAPGSAGAATDVAAVGQGNGTITRTNGTCSAPLALTFNVRSNVAAVTESWGPGGPNTESCALATILRLYPTTTAPVPAVQQCLPGISIHSGGAWTLSQSGQTYTMQRTYRLCNGKQIFDKIVVTVQATRLVYSNTYAENGVTLVTVTANVPRIA